MIVLGLFNGMNTGRQALENQGFHITKYYSSELKPVALKLTQHHFPDTIQLGDIRNWRQWNIDWKNIDLILSGSPCQDLSIAGKRKGLNGEKSSLFWVFIEILNYVKSLNPNVLFFQENVGSATKKDIGIMSRAMGVYPVRFNSSSLVAQLRDRYYWTNIRTKKNLFDTVVDIPEPKDRKIMFQDILTDGYTDREKARAILERESRSLINKAKLYKRYNSGFQNIVYLDKYKDLLEIDGDKLKVKTNTKEGYQYAEKYKDCLNLTFPKSTSRRGRITKGKSPCLLKGNEPLFVFTGDNIRLLNKEELCKLQGFPSDYCDIITRNQAASLLGDGWTLPMIEHFFSFIEGFQKTTINN